jgi:hypothetical protein
MYGKLSTNRKVHVLAKLPDAHFVAFSKSAVTYAILLLPNRDNHFLSSIVLHMSLQNRVFSPEWHMTFIASHLPNVLCGFF